MIKKITIVSCWFVAVLFAFLLSCKPQQATEEQTGETEEVAEETTAEKPKIASPRKQAAGKVSGADIVVDYGSPAVKGRTIWGGLEAWGKVWRAGANETTSIEFSSDVTIGDKKVTAGKYGFYMMPNEDADWIAILNTDWNREKHGAWGAYNYNQKNDVVRLSVTPEWAEETQERLEYLVSDNGITLAWEKARLTIPISPAK